MYNSQPTRSYRATVANSDMANLSAARTHTLKAAETIVATAKMLSADDPRREELRQRYHDLQETVELFARAHISVHGKSAQDELELAREFRRTMLARRHAAEAIRAQVLDERKLVRELAHDLAATVNGLGIMQHPLTVDPEMCQREDADLEVCRHALPTIASHHQRPN